MVLCACSNKQMYEVERAVKEAAPESFIIILESNEVHGEGFSITRVAEAPTRILPQNTQTSPNHQGDQNGQTKA